MEYKIYTDVDSIPWDGYGRIGKDLDAAGERKRRVRKSGKRGRKSRRKQAIRRRKICLGITLFLVFGTLFYARGAANVLFEMGQGRVWQFLNSIHEEEYPQELLEMVENNPETYDFVAGYPQRELYQEKEIDISGICQKGQAPLLLQWDLRWGYDSYGDSMIGVAGCGPTCMTMAYLCLTGDASMDPRKMASYASEKGYHTEAGTSWNFFTEGAADLGLSGSEAPLSETAMKQVLDQGGVLISSMRPGDFTTTGHFILIRGYDQNGFFVNDPNSRRNSEKQWDYETLSGQIKGLWEIAI